MIAFDADDERIVRMSLPFWLLRLRLGDGSPTVTVDGSRFDLEELKLTVEDLERYGPTLIVDHQEPGRDRVLVWSQ